MVDFNKYEKKKKIGIIVAIVVLVLIVIIAIIVATRPKKTNAKPTKSKKKAVESICQPTEFKDTCEKSLSPVAGNTSDPKELIKLAFHETMKDIDVAIKNTTILQQAAGNDPRAVEALKGCNNLLNNSNNDLKKCSDKLDTIELSNLVVSFKDIKRWLKGAVNNQQACLDGFKNVAGDAGQKMQELLKTPMELTRNGHTMINGLGTVFPSLDNVGLGRRLLSVH